MSARARIAPPAVNQAMRRGQGVSRIQNRVRLVVPQLKSVLWSAGSVVPPSQAQRQGDHREWIHHGGRRLGGT